MWYVSIKYALSTNLCRFDVKLHLLKRILLTPLFFIVFISSFGQTSQKVPLVNADSVKLAVSLFNESSLFVDSTAEMNISQVATAGFHRLTASDTTIFKRRSKAGYRFYLKFTIKNDALVTKDFFYYPGKLFDKINIYKRTGDEFVLLKTDRLHEGFIPIRLLPGETAEYITKLKFFKTSFNRINPKLISSAYFKPYKNDLFGSLNTKRITGIMLSGMLLMMMLVTLLYYFISRRREFLYNSMYSFCMFLLIFLSTSLHMNPAWFKGFFISYLDLLLLVVGINFYLAFTRNFLDTAHLYPRLDKLLKIGALVFSALMGVFTLVFFFSNVHVHEIYLENIMKIFILVIAILFIFLAFVQKNRLINYLAVGVGTQLLFSSASLVFSLVKTNAEHIYNSPIFYFGMGIICSLISFLLGLFYKNKLELITTVKEQEAMKLEVEKQAFENKLTVYKTQQEERNRISADMHDDLGAGMTSIRLYSELAKGRFKDMVVPELEKISASANELIDNMNAIIWSMSSQNDSLQNMIAYIRSYTIEYLESTGIKAIVTIPEKIPDLVISGTIRRNIFLVIKEALQNVVKHSDATKLVITMGKEPEGFSLVIHDNGKGIDFDNLRPHSNGLKNMQKRMQDVNLEFKIENNQGTWIRLYAKTR